MNEKIKEILEKHYPIGTLSKHEKDLLNKAIVEICGEQTVATARQLSKYMRKVECTLVNIAVPKSQPECLIKIEIP